VGCGRAWVEAGGLCVSLSYPLDRCADGLSMMTYARLELMGHKQQHGRRYRCATRNRTAQLPTNRMLSTTPVRCVMRQVASNYSHAIT
jgi:hypothetical protein